MRSRRGRMLAAVVACACGVSTLSATAAAEGGGKKPPAFSDGSWHGSTTPAGGGTITRGDIFGATEAEVEIEFRVRDAEVTDGRMASVGRSASDVPGANASQEFSGSFDITGPAEEPVFEGTTSFSGTVTAGGITVPYQGEGPGGGTLPPTTATCSKVTGDLAFRGRQLQEQEGFATDVTAPFVALRVKDKDAERVLAEFDALALEISLLLAEIAAFGDPAQAVEQLFQLVQKAAALLNSVRALKACGAIPAGFKEGLADGYFADIFTKLVSALLARADELTAAQVLTLLYVAYETGVVGPAAPDKPLAEDILNQFENVLSTKVDEALADGDIHSLTEILAAAEQLGLKDLAAKADQAIDEYLADQQAGLAASAPLGGGGDRGLGDLPDVDETVELTAPSEDGAGKVPTFKWKRVDGATTYRLAVVNDDGEGFWAYQGAETSVVLGRMQKRPPKGEAGPIITDGSRWSVIALDAEGAVIAASDFRDVSP